MRRTLRLGVLACVGVVALAVAGQAFAAYAPKLTASTTSAGTTISYMQVASDDAPLATTFFVPTGYAATLGQAAGSTIGTVTAQAAAADLGGATLPLTGTVVVSDAATLGASATTCTGSAAHSAFWVLVLTAAGQTLQVPIYVDQIPIGNPLGAFATYTMTICLPPPDVPPGTAGRAAFGAKVIEASFTVKGVFTAPAGEARWRMRATPYAPGIGTPNAAGTVETQSIEKGAGAVTLAAKAAGKKKAAVSGKVTQGGTGVAGATVQIKAGKKVIGTAKTDSSGNYKAAVKLPSASATLTATATVATQELGASACSATFPPVPCIGATSAGFSATSKAVKVKT